MDNDFRVGAWIVRPSLNTISQNGVGSRLAPKVIQVLVCLASQPGELLPKDDILKTVWPESFISDDVLIRSISELRRVFEDDARDPRFIETIPKRFSFAFNVADFLALTGALMGFPEFVAPIDHAFRTAGFEAAIHSLARNFEKLQKEGNLYAPEILAEFTASSET